MLQLKNAGGKRKKKIEKKNKSYGLDENNLSD